MTTITARLRLADDSTVPIVLRETPHGWLAVVTTDGEPIGHCRRGHVLLHETTWTDRRGYRHCAVCDRDKKRAANRRYYANHKQRRARAQATQEGRK